MLIAQSQPMRGNFTKIMDKESYKLLEQINKSLIEINLRQKFNEDSSETDKLIEKSDRRVENSINQIQNTFDRIHDKVFNFNNGSS